MSLAPDPLILVGLNREGNLDFVAVGYTAELNNDIATLTAELVFSIYLALTSEYLAELFISAFFLALAPPYRETLSEKPDWSIEMISLGLLIYS